MYPKGTLRKFTPNHDLFLYAPPTATATEKEISEKLEGPIISYLAVQAS